MNASPRLTLIAVIGLCLLTQGCAPSKPDGNNGGTPFLDEAANVKPLPYDKLLDGAFPPLRQDAFYTTYIDEGGKKSTLHDRFVSNGKGFVAYCPEEGFDDGYYLYNFYGHNSYFVQIKERSYKATTKTPGDDLIIAFQAFTNSRMAHLPKGTGPYAKLPVKKIDDINCEGLQYTDPDGARREEWFEVESRRLRDQTIEGQSRKLTRHLKRANAFCETMLLRLPEGFTLEKDSVK